MPRGPGHSRAASAVTAVRARSRRDNDHLRNLPRQAAALDAATEYGLDPPFSPVVYGAFDAAITEILDVTHRAPVASSALPGRRARRILAPQRPYALMDDALVDHSIQ